MREALLDVKGLSSLLQVHPKTVYEWAKAGRIPALSLNGRVRFDPAEIDRFIAARRPKFVDLEPRLQIAGYSPIACGTFLPKGGKDALSKNSRRCRFGFGTIYSRKTKRGKESWYLDYRNRQGERIREVAKGATTREEALIVLQERAGDNLLSSSPALRKYRTVRFSELATVYIEDHAKIKKRSWKNDDYMVQTSLRPYFGEKLLAEITPLEIERWIRWRLEQDVTKTTVNRGLQVLKKMFNIAIGEGFTTENPVRQVKLFPEKDNIKERILTEEEEPRLLEACVDYLRPVVITALHTGMRRGEILALDWARVDLEKRLIKVTNTKTDRPRWIEINATLLEVLRRQRIANPTSELVFASPRTGRLLNGIRKAFVRACKQAGIVGLRFHDLRHTFASRLIEKGVDIVTVKELLGHSTIILTQRYTHSRNEQRRRAVEKLDEQPATVLSHGGHTAEGQSPVNRYFSMN